MPGCKACKECCVFGVMHCDTLLCVSYIERRHNDFNYKKRKGSVFSSSIK